MEDSEKRKERLKAMRAIAAENETSSSSTNAEKCTVPPFLANPLLEAAVTPGRVELRATQRFDFYTDPMAAFSANRRRSNVAGNLVSQDNTTSHGNFGSSMARFSSPRQGQRYPQMNSSPGHQIPSNYVPFQGMHPPQGSYHSANPYRSPRGIASRSPMHQGPSPEGWNVPGDLSGCHGSAYPRGMTSPYPVHRGSPSFNHGRGRGAWTGNNPWHVGDRNPGFARGGGRGRGFHLSNSAPGGTLGPERFYDNSMIEDPWQHLQPVLWRGPDASSNNLNSSGSSNSWLPKSISMKKPRTSESASFSNSKQSLAEYLAASFNEASKDA